MSVLKIEAFSGLSGDMFLGALADLAEAHDELKNLPKLLHLENVEVKITAVEKAGIACQHIKILDHNSYESSKHDHSHGHHRHLKDIEKIIDSGELNENTKSIAKEIFQLLGAAESKVHGTDINKIHFHEVGAIDSILDIVGTAFLIDRLEIEKTISSPICTGHGFVMTEHGRLPVPCPATKELLLNFPTYAGDVKGEMTTPTGAAILKYLNPSFNIPALIEKKTGHGPGEKNFEHPNVLRLTLCDTTSGEGEDILMVETNIDDMSAELLGNDFQENLLKAGALDFYFTQIIMKKGRPGIMVSVFVNKDKVQNISDYLMENTTTIGIRTYPAYRHTLKRTSKTISTSMGNVDIKEVILPSGKKRATLEYESCKKLAQKHKLSISEIFSILSKEI